jgi:FtsP/CotA-like multicopper oxidase with cupredoxin domain
MKAATNTVNIFDLKVGNVVHFHGARFEVISTEVQEHRSFRGEFNADRDTVMVAKAKWLDGGIVNGYFGPNKDWTFQGNKNVTEAVEI